VSLGAALHAYHLARKQDGKGFLGDQPVALKQATGHDLGVALMDTSTNQRKSICWAMVPKNTVVPYEFKDSFKLERPNQTDVIVEILQGVHQSSSGDCLCIGSAHLKNLPPEPQLTSRIEILFAVDKNMIGTVTVTDKLSGISQTVSVKFNTKKAT
jgi:molecular chaperone DnaK (HSP70)